VQPAITFLFVKKPSSLYSGWLFFEVKIMKIKLKITITLITIISLIAVIPVFNAFNLTEEKIDSSFTESSTYTVEGIEKTKIIEKNVSVEDNLIEKEAILSRISDNLDKEIKDINKEYKAEVLGSVAIADKPADTTVIAASSPVSLNDFESAILYLINTTRVSNGLGALEANQQLTDIARSRSNDMIASSYFSHYTPDGRNIFNFLKENGVSYANGGENLGQSSPASSGTPEAFINAWMASPTHKANILRSVYSKIGVGVSDNGNRRVITTVFTN
jgi:uncharacterized protein YkwD